ncbi:JmjC domain-containing histone demethylation protein 1 [Psilocybe cubensis]|uniref:JmjC domain-containing histone demethylation protein 1 n=2 Tax=Psilocybe cubensis TaxID=181762 RepID=A0ACB8H814_PSICU|nr:JmjC domain-containing histone demethylation protein 1 [Psilocybe cubensis]KAH9483854.1 JmjC domain-containing histone demethylation protein 1 [Psilocybe cubensis]
MAPAKRRASNRNSLKPAVGTAAEPNSPSTTTPIRTPEATPSNGTLNGDGAPSIYQGKEKEPANEDESDQRCPACTEETLGLINGSRRENWIECDNCNTWYHWRCAGNGEDVNNIAKWYCEACTKADPSRIMTLKPPARKSSRKRTQRDYASLDSGMGSDPNRFFRMLETKDIKPDPFRRMKGSELDTWLEEDDSAMREPIVIEQPDGLGMKMPPRDLTVEHVAEYIGEDVPLEVMDVASQSTAPGWNLGKWADYVELEPSKREKVLNVISLEISGTELADMVLPPKIVRDLDWVENFWPSTRKGKNNAYPKVQLYCLMGVAGAWTDWHIDFAGSSVYYHILHGSKVFYFIRPTAANLAAYEKWSGSELQYQTWLGDMVDEVYKVELVEGNTMIIPSGWIHAVHTPVDTLVFGGNFLHSYDVATQLRVREIEMATQVPKKFTFPMFTKLCWYVGDKYLRDLKSASGASYPPRVLDGMLRLAEFLVSEARVLETGSDAAKKEAKESIPADRVKDGPAVARELRWRVKQAMGYASDEEGSKTKRQRVGSGHFRHFRPKIWDLNASYEDGETEEVVAAKRPESGTGLEESWLGGVVAGEDKAVVRRRVERVSKVRRTGTGLERHVIERRIEEWKTAGAAPLYFLSLFSRLLLLTPPTADPPQYDDHLPDSFSTLSLADPIPRAASAMSHASAPPRTHPPPRHAMTLPPNQQYPHSAYSDSAAPPPQHYHINGPPPPHHNEYDDYHSAYRSPDSFAPHPQYPPPQQHLHPHHHQPWQPPPPPQNYHNPLFAAASNVLGMAPPPHPQGPPIQRNPAHAPPMSSDRSVYAASVSSGHSGSSGQPSFQSNDQYSVQQHHDFDPRPPYERAATSASLAPSSTKSKAVDLSSPPFTKEYIDQYRQRIKADPDPEAHFLYAKYLIDAAKHIRTSNTDARGAKKYSEVLIGESLKVIRRLATQGEAYDEAQFFLANCYGTGALGLQVDHERAYHLYLQAAKQNHAAASYRVAVCNEIGAGTKKEPSRAAAFYRKAASLGDTPGMFKLGMVLLNGALGEQKNPREAISWLKRAAEQADEDNPHALHELALLYENQTGALVPYDPAYAKSLLTQAAQLGYTPSQYKLGQCYEYGSLTCPVDPRRSIAWYTKAAEKGDAEAELALSGWYLTGSEGVLKQSDSEAYLWARRAANKGLSKAEYAVGYYAEVGIGIKQDIEFAKRWYMRAAAQGNKRAMNRLTEMKRMGNKRGNVARPTRQQAKDECVIS